MQKTFFAHMAGSLSTGVWWPRTAIKNIQISRDQFCYFFKINFDLFVMFLFKIKASKSKM